MNNRFKRALTVSTALHVALVVVLVLGPVVMRLLKPRKPKEIITLVELVPPPPPAPPEPESPAPEPEPDVPAPPKTPVEKKPETKPEKPKIKVNTNRVVRKDVPKVATPPRTTLTPEQIKKLLEANVRFSQASGTPATGYSDLQVYYTIVHQKMYDAWSQPGSVARGLAAEASIRVARNGALLQRRVSRSSGDALMDQSVRAALDAVGKLPALPDSVGGPHLDITIEFVVGDGF